MLPIFESIVPIFLLIVAGNVLRRLPVVDDKGELVGVISLDDILDLLAEEFNLIGELLRRENPTKLSAV